MDNLLEIYFKKARKSLSEPVPISEIRKRLASSPGTQATKFWLQTRFQVVLVLALAFLGLYLFVDYRATNEKMTIENEAPKEEQILTLQVETLIHEKILTRGDETPIQEVTSKVESGLSKNTDEEVLPLKINKITPNVQLAETSEAKEKSPVVQNTLKESDTIINTQVLNSYKTTEPATLHEMFVDKLNNGSSDATPGNIESSQFISKHEFEILPGYSERRLKKLDKELLEYGITMKIGALKYDDKNKISKIKGEFISLNTNKKVRFNTNTFNKIIFNFDYSKSKGPANMIVSGK